MQPIDEVAFKKKQDENPYGRSELAYQAMHNLEEYQDKAQKEKTLSRRRILLALLLVFGWLCSKVAFQWRFGAQRSSPSSAQATVPIESRVAGDDPFDWYSVSSMFLLSL